MSQPLAQRQSKVIARVKDTQVMSSFLFLETEDFNEHVEEFTFYHYMHEP